MSEDAEAPRGRPLPESMMGAIGDTVYAIVEHAQGPSLMTKYRLGEAIEGVVREILAEVDRRIVGCPR